MIDALKRRQLSSQLRHLVTGRATNDQFDEWYYNDYEESQDRAVQAVSAFGYGLYSSDVLSPYRLRGIHAVDSRTRTTAARCVLFLRSSLEYEWPDQPDSPAARLLQGMAFFLGLPVGIVLGLISIPLIFTRDTGFAIWLGAAGASVLILSAWLSWFWNPCAAVRGVVQVGRSRGLAVSAGGRFRSDATGGSCVIASWPQFSGQDWR